MSVTLTLPPAYGGSLYEDVWVAAISSASGQTDLKYVVEVYNGADKIFEGKVYPNPTDKYMYFDSAPMLRNLFSENYIDSGSLSYAFEDVFPLTSRDNFGFDIRIGTDYSGITTLNEASGVVGAMGIRPKFFNKRFLKKSLQLEVSNKWQTDRAYVASISKNTDNFFISFRNTIATTNNAIASPVLEWTSYDSSGTQISTDSEVIPNPISAGSLNSYAQLNIGPESLGRIIGSSPDMDTCAYYIVTLTYTDNYDSQEYVLTFRINKHCETKYQSIPIHFLNRYHSYDTMRFDLVSRTTVDVERKSYNQQDYRFNAGSVLYTDASASGTTVYRENKINYNTTYNYTMKLTSDLLDDQDWEWLEDLIESPKIYMEDDGYFYPVTIKATNYEISKYINNRLRPLEIEIEFNSPRLSGAR